MSCVLNTDLKQAIKVRIKKRIGKNALIYLSKGEVATSRKTGRFCNIVNNC